MGDIKESLKILGFSGDENVNEKFTKELRKMFKKKSIAMLPEKHPTVPNAHSRFEEVNSAFVSVSITWEETQTMYFLLTET